MSIFLIYIIIIIICLVFLLIKNIIYYDYENSPFPIDVVYTWKGEKVTDNVRGSYNHELQYSLRSIDLYAPWVNKIYILTDYPVKYPSWINKKNNKIKLVYTKDTFPSPDYLPNSNSNAIETTITNIKGLSEHYIYFCDDFFLGKITKYTDFFTPCGKAIVDKTTTESNDILKEPRYNLLNINFPPSLCKLYKHIPLPQIKSSIIEFNKEYADYIHWIRMTKSRNRRGFDICEESGLNSPCQQIHYPICKYMYLHNKAIIGDFGDKNTKILVKNNDKNLRELLDEIYTVRPLFFCINDDETDANKRALVREILLQFFIAYFPNKASFEK